MSSSKGNKKQDIQQNETQSIIFKITQSSIFKQRMKIVKILCSAIHIFSNIFLITRIRFPQIGNFCLSQNYDSKYGCNSVFKTLIDYTDSNIVENGNNNNLDQDQVLSFAEQQVVIDQQSSMSIMQYIAPIYLLIFLFQNISELTNKKQKIDILIFILVLIAITDLMFFNASYTFSLIKPNRLDSKIFNTCFNLFTQSLIRQHNQNSLMFASNNIFQQTSIFFIIVPLFTKIMAIFITSYQFIQQILTIQSISIFQQKFIQLLKNSISFQKNQKSHKNNQNVKNSKQNGSTKITKTSSNCDSETNISTSNDKFSTSINNYQSNTHIQCANTPILMQKNSNMLEQITDKQNNTIFTQVESNKKSICANKKKSKNQQNFTLNQQENIQNQKILKSNQNFQNNGVENLKQFEENQQKMLRELEIFRRSEDDGNSIKSNIVDLKTKLDHNKEQELINSENNENQEQQMTTLINEKLLDNIMVDSQSQNKYQQIEEIETNQFSFEFQKQNHQNSLNSSNSSKILKIKIFEDSDNIERQYTNCFTKEENNYNVFNNSHQELLLNDHVLEIVQNSTLNLSLQSSQQFIIQNSNQNLCLNESDQMVINNTNNNSNINGKEASPKSFSPVCPNEETNNQMQYSQNDCKDILKQNTQPNNRTEQIIIEQPNDDIRKKWALKQKAMKLEKMKLEVNNNQIDSNNTENNYINNSNNNNNNSIGNMHNTSLLSISDNNSYCPQGNSNLQNYSSLNDQVIFQEDLDISTNDESNFTSINSNYDASSITKQNRNCNSMNLKNLSQHLLNQQVAQVLAQQRGHHQACSKSQQVNDKSHIDYHKDPSIQFQNYKNTQYQEEQCYNDDHLMQNNDYGTGQHRTSEYRTSDHRTSGQVIQERFDNQNIYFEDDCEKTSQCLKQYVQQNQIDNQQYLNQQNSQTNMNDCPLKQQNTVYGFNHEDDECNQIQGKTPFELFYDKQCLLDDEYDEEEELDQFHENTDEDNSDEYDDEDESEDEDEDEDGEEYEYSFQVNKKRINFENKMKQNSCNSINYLENSENQIYTSAFLQSQLHHTAETFSIDEQRDYLDIINSEHNLDQQIIYELNSKKIDLSQLSSQQDFTQEQQDNLADDGKKKRKKKKKTKEQNQKRRTKRKNKRRLEKQMTESGLEGSINETTQTEQTDQDNVNLCKTKKKKFYKQKKKQNNNLKNSDILFNSNNQYENQDPNDSSFPFHFYSNSCNNLKKYLDENLLEYFTFSVILNQGFTINIYITDFYQFDEQFEMQSRTYGMDESMILDSKINIIFEIMQQNIYPAITPFFEHLIQQYSTAKISSCQLQLTQLLCSEYLNINNNQYISTDTKQEEQNLCDTQHTDNDEKNQVEYSEIISV